MLSMFDRMSKKDKISFIKRKPYLGIVNLIKFREEELEVLIEDKKYGQDDYGAIEAYKQAIKEMKIEANKDFPGTYPNVSSSRGAGGTSMAYAG